MNTEQAAAHLVAKHLREIARLLPLLSVEGVEAFTPGLKATDVVPYAELLTVKAERMEATAPFEPVSDEDKADIRIALIEECGDMSGRDNAENVYAEWTEAEWRMEKDDRDEMERDEP